MLTSHGLSRILLSKSSIGLLGARRDERFNKERC